VSANPAPAKNQVTSTAVPASNDGAVCHRIGHYPLEAC
jgi:hypothetical protein